MAQIDDNSGGRDVNVELNLVPFIDLMSVCIIFLLLTAVWTQVSMIQIGSSIYAKKADPNDAPAAPEDKTEFRLSIVKAGYVVSVNSASVQIPLVNGVHDEEKLLAYLKRVKEKYQQKNDAIISVEDSLKFDHLIRGMDILMQSGFPEISVATNQ